MNETENSRIKMLFFSSIPLKNIRKYLHKDEKVEEEEAKEVKNRNALCIYNEFSSLFLINRFKT